MAHSPADPPRIPTGQELFDTLMEYIEPELTTKNVAGLTGKYRNETPEEREERRRRYAIAFERYDQAYADYMDTLQAQVSRYRRQSFGEVEMEDRRREDGVLSHLVQSLA